VAAVVGTLLRTVDPAMNCATLRPYVPVSPLSNSVLHRKLIPDGRQNVSVARRLSARISTLSHGAQLPRPAHGYKFSYTLYVQRQPAQLTPPPAHVAPIKPPIHVSRATKGGEEGAEGAAAPGRSRLGEQNGLTRNILGATATKVSLMKFAKRAISGGPLQQLLLVCLPSSLGINTGTTTF